MTLMDRRRRNDTLRGKVAIVGIGEVPTRRVIPDRTMYGLNAEAAKIAIADAGLRKEDINGLVTDGAAALATMAEYIGIRPTFATGVSMQGASGASATTVAASAINGGLADTVLVVMGNSRLDRAVPGGASVRSEWEEAYGPAAGAGTGYAQIYTRHMYEFGTTQEQMAIVAANQRFNAQENENAVFHGQPASKEDVLSSRYINYPLRILESVMPCDGAAALIMTRADRAKSFPHRPVYLLGAGMEQSNANIWQTDRITTTPVKTSAARAFQMSGYGPGDMQFAEFYDCYTILVAVTLEDAGFVEKGEIGPFYESTDTTYKGSFPINTDGGQLSGGQPGLAGGFRHVIEGARQIMGRGGGRQVALNDLCMVNG